MEVKRTGRGSEGVEEGGIRGGNKGKKGYYGVREGKKGRDIRKRGKWEDVKGRDEVSTRKEENGKK